MRQVSFAGGSLAALATMTALLAAAAPALAQSQDKKDEPIGQSSFLANCAVGVVKLPAGRGIAERRPVVAPGVS